MPEATNPQELVRRINRELETYLHSLPVGVVIAGKTGKLEFVNRRFAEMAGVPLPAVTDIEGFAKVIGYVIAGTNTPYPVERSALRQALQGKTAKVEDGELLRPDGSRVALEATGVPIHDDSGVVYKAMSVCTDVTYRRHAEAELARNYRLLFENNPQPMWFFDIETLAFLEVNNAAIAKYGYSLEEFRGMRITDIRPAEDVQRLLKVMRERPDFHFSGVWKHVKRDGGVIDVEITSQQIEFEGRAARFVMAVDVTDRERLQRQLLQAGRLESLGQLAGGVAHDFNNLLAVILNYGDFVQDQLTKAAETDPGGSWPQAQRDMQQIIRAAERAAGLTRQLLAFARRDVVQPRLVNVNEVIEETESFLNRSLGEHVRLEKSLYQDVWPLFIDPGQMEQVLVNLAVNARDAMPGGGTLTIDTENIEVDADYAALRPGLQAGRYVRIRVSDTGIGMDQETAEHAFEPFFTTKPKDEGTGLGLATVYGIVTQANGRVQIYSEPGRGTTFTVLLPAADDNNRQDEESPATTPRPEGGNATILLVEDAESLSEVTSRILRRHGFEVLVASNGVEAVELARNHAGKIDLLLTDVVLPKMMGDEVARRVAEILPGIPVLYVSGYAQPVLAAQGSLSPGMLLLEKPFSAGSLLEKVHQALSAATSSQP